MVLECCFCGWGSIWLISMLWIASISSPHLLPFAPPLYSSLSHGPPFFMFQAVHKKLTHHFMEVLSQVVSRYVSEPFAVANQPWEFHLLEVKFAYCNYHYSTWLYMLHCYMQLLVFVSLNYMYDLYITGFYYFCMLRKVTGLCNWSVRQVALAEAPKSLKVAKARAAFGSCRNFLYCFATPGTKKCSSWNSGNVSNFWQARLCHSLESGVPELPRHGRSELDTTELILIVLLLCTHISCLCFFTWKIAKLWDVFKCELKQDTNVWRGH